MEREWYKMFPNTRTTVNQRTGLCHFTREACFAPFVLRFEKHSRKDDVDREEGRVSLSPALGLWAEQSGHGEVRVQLKSLKGGWEVAKLATRVCTDG